MFDHHLERCSVCNLTLQKYFSHPSLVIYLLFCNFTHKTETGTANRWGGTTNSKPAGPITTMGRSETLLISSLIRTLLRHHVPATANYAIMLSQNHFLEPNWHVLTFLDPTILPCRITYWAPLEMLFPMVPFRITYWAPLEMLFPTVPFGSWLVAKHSISYSQP